MWVLFNLKGEKKRKGGYWYYSTIDFEIDLFVKQKQRDKFNFEI